jgi:membrane protein
MLRTRSRAFFPLLAQAGRRFFADDTFQEGAALAYFAVFALPAFLILVVRVAGAVLGPSAVSGALFKEIQGILGESGARDVQHMVEKAARDEGLSVAALVGTVALVVAATGVFASMQKTLNAVWGVRARPAKAWVKVIADRTRSFGLILAVAFLLLISLVAQTALSALGNLLTRWLPGAELIWIHVANVTSSVLLSTVLFASIFKFLPDVHVRWRDVWAGALVTALLFTGGKALIGLYLGHSNLGSVYGAAGTVIVLLSWVYYSSQIMFFGAVFTRCHAEAFGRGIRPSSHAVRVQITEVREPAPDESLDWLE